MGQKIFQGFMGPTAKVSVVIPTVDRRDQLLRAVLGALGQEGVDGAFEVVVVDNSPGGRQGWILDAVSARGASAVPLRRVHEPRAGLTFARNCGVTKAVGEFVAFIDDDEEPKRDWLAAHMRALEVSRGDASFGPVVPVFEETPKLLADFARELYTRQLSVAPHADVTAKFNYLGTGNACFRVATCFSGNVPPFNLRFNRTGGEDIEFLRRLASSRRRLIWAADAVVEEFVPVGRATADYMARRRFAQGALRSYSQISCEPRRFDKMAFWMGVGLVQYLYHSVLRAAAGLVGRQEASLLHGVKAQGGLGKMCWQLLFRSLRYG